MWFIACLFYCLRPFLLEPTQHTNQPTNQPNNQPNNQPTRQPTHTPANQLQQATMIQRCLLVCLIPQTTLSNEFFGPSPRDVDRATQGKKKKQRSLALLVRFPDIALPLCWGFTQTQTLQDLYLCLFACVFAHHVFSTRMVAQTQRKQHVTAKQQTFPDNLEFMHISFRPWWRPWTTPFRDWRQRTSCTSCLQRGWKRSRRFLNLWLPLSVCRFSSSSAA